MIPKNIHAHTMGSILNSEGEGEGGLGLEFLRLGGGGEGVTQFEIPKDDMSFV